MQSIEVIVKNETDLRKLISELDKMKFVKSYRPLSKAKKGVDSIAYASEASLAEDWLTAEDARYEKYFRK